VDCDKFWYNLAKQTLKSANYKTQPTAKISQRKSANENRPSQV